MPFLLPRPGTSGLSTKWEITKRCAHLWSKTLKPRQPAGRCYRLLAVFWTGGCAITWCQQNGLLTPWLTCVSLQVLTCSLFFAITPFFCCIGSLTMGCDPRNNRKECANSLSNRFWKRYKASICPRLGWGVADSCTHCQLTMGLELWMSVLVVSTSDEEPQHEHSIQESIIFYCFR